MRGSIRILAAAAALSAAIADTAWAEKVLPVNDNNTGRFDQPSAAQHGSVTHVAFIGDTDGTGYKVYYAAINSSADFTNVNLPRDNTVILTPATPIDNTDAGNDAYADARHPKIAIRSASEVVILFQAKPQATDNAYRPYLARLSLANNAVVGRSVKKIQGIPDGDVEDISFVLVPSDNTARMVFELRSTIAAPEPFEVFFARVGVDNAAAAGTPLQLTASYPASAGFRPVPAIAVDDLSRGHIAWSATDDSGTNPGAVYYAMVKETGGIDNMVIAPTAVMSRFPMRWSFPNVLVFSRSLITILASDEVRGDLGFVQLNPDAARQDGLSAWDNITANNAFLLVPPGEAILPPDFRLFRPESFYEALSGRIFLTGYGSGGSGATAGTFFAIKLNTVSGLADFVTFPTPFGMSEPPSALDNDYTKAAFGFPGGKVVVFWSGLLSGGNRNLDVSTIPTVNAFVNAEEKGCSVAVAGGAPAVPAVLPLVAAILFLGVRRRIGARSASTVRRDVED